MSRRMLVHINSGSGWEASYAALHRATHRPNHGPEHAECCGRRCGLCGTDWPCRWVAESAKRHPAIKPNRRRTHRRSA